MLSNRPKTNSFNACLVLSFPFSLEKENNGFCQIVVLPIVGPLLVITPKTSHDSRAQTLLCYQKSAAHNLALLSIFKSRSKSPAKITGYL